VLEAAIKAVDAVDACVTKVAGAILKMGGEVIISADHGNAEKMTDEDGGPFTAHTIGKVPLILVSDRFKHSNLREDGILADIAPTMLFLMGLPIPKEMTGRSLIEETQGSEI
jgi:2,3-bisphosphoglycerate-independent phosphoglycerate mutase